MKTQKIESHDSHDQPDSNPVNLVNPVHFSDTEFFRRLVAERARLLEGAFASPYWVGCDIKTMANAIAYQKPTAAQQTEFLVRIAALCERAAVDITIPNSRLATSRSSRFKSEGRARRSARAASGKGSK